MISAADWYRLDVEARLILALEALECGDVAEAVGVLTDLEGDLAALRYRLEGEAAA